MEKLIQIKQENGRQLVDARELHEFLESKQQFGDWIKDRINKYGFIENEEYTTFHKIMKRGTGLSGGSRRIEYALTLDMAKEISMLENNEKGQQARRYFIKMEKKAKTSLDSISRKELAKMLYESEDEKEKLQQETEEQQKELKEAQPKVEYYEDVLTSESSYTTTEIAKELGMSAIILNRKLHKLGIQYKISGTWVLYALYQNEGYTDTRTYTYPDKNEKVQTKINTVWTEKGRKFIHDLMPMDWTFLQKI